MDLGKEFKNMLLSMRVFKVHGPICRCFLTPYIIEERQMNVAQMDVFSRLMMDRIIFLGTGINDQIANIAGSVVVPRKCRR